MNIVRENLVIFYNPPLPRKNNNNRSHLIYEIKRLIYALFAENGYNISYQFTKCKRNTRAIDIKIANNKWEN